MKLYTIDTGFFKLDGGAMFGVVPKSLWNKVNPADNNNLCTWAMRCLLVQEGSHLILVDTGMGNKQSEKFFSYYEPHGDATLEGRVNLRLPYERRRDACTGSKSKSRTTAICTGFPKSEGLGSAISSVAYNRCTARQHGSNCGCGRAAVDR